MKQVFSALPTQFPKEHLSVLLTTANAVSDSQPSTTIAVHRTKQRENSTNMAAFLEDLWTSIFTPGPTSTLLIATNITFAALQSILLALLIATYSIHFVVLSVISAGLWGAINWFAKEVMIAQALQEEGKRAAGGNVGNEGELLGESMESSAISEVDETQDITTRPLRTRKSIVSEADSEVSDGRPQGGAWNTGAATRLAPQGADSLRQRSNMSESIGDLSTDSEWEKVDDER